MLVPFILAMFLAINMGGSGVGPSFSTAFAADVIRKSFIAGLFGIMVFVGAIVAGDKTAITIGSGIINADLMSPTQVSIILFSVSISLLIANLFGVPQSTSQSTVLAVVAPGVLLDNFSTNRLFIEIIPMWFVLPVMAFVFCYSFTKFLYIPLKNKSIGLINKFSNTRLDRYAIVLVSMYVAFSIGSNNVANASGPLAAMINNRLGFDNINMSTVIVMMLCTMIVAPCFGIGASVFGDRILRSTGKDLFLFGKGEALLISIVSATLLLMASLVRGIPTSLVQLNVGAILGVGIANVGAKTILAKTSVRKFFYMWIISPVVAFVLSLVLTYWLVM